MLSIVCIVCCYIFVFLISYLLYTDISKKNKNKVQCNTSQKTTKNHSTRNRDFGANILLENHLSYFILCPRSGGSLDASKVLNSAQTTHINIPKCDIITVTHICIHLTSTSFPTNGADRELFARYIFHEKLTKIDTRKNILIWSFTPSNCR